MNIEKPDKPETNDWNIYAWCLEHGYIYPEQAAKAAQTAYQYKRNQTEPVVIVYEQLREYIGKLRDIANEIDRVADELEKLL